MLLGALGRLATSGKHLKVQACRAPLRCDRGENMYCASRALVIAAKFLSGGSDNYESL